MFVLVHDFRSYMFTWHYTLRNRVPYMRLKLLTAKLLNLMFSCVADVDVHDSKNVTMEALHKKSNLFKYAIMFGFHSLPFVLNNYEVCYCRDLFWTHKNTIKNDM